MKTGIHILLDIDQCNKHLLYSEKTYLEIQSKITSLGLTVLDHSSKVFPGNGYTAFFLLAESHISIHTWPEIQKVYADIF